MFFKSEKHRTLFTERLKLRAPSFLDVNDVFDFCSDPDSCKYADWYPHNNKSETRDFIARAGFALSHSNKFDVIIEYFIKQKNYRIGNKQCGNTQSPYSNVGKKYRKNN